MNLSIGAAAQSYLSIPTARVAPEAASAGGGKPAASFDDDWCPTRPPVPPRPHVEIHSQLEALVGGAISGGGKLGLDDDWCGTKPKFPFPPPPPGPWGF